MPAQHRQLASGGHHRDLEPPPRPDSLIERPQRPGRLARHPGGLDQHAAGIGPALLRDVAVHRREVAGLADLRVEAEVADQLVGRGEPAEVSDRRDDGNGDRHVDAGDGHQPAHVGLLQGHLGQFRVEEAELFAFEVQLAQQRLHCAALVGGQGLGGQPTAPFPAEQVGRRAAWQEVPGQDRLHLVLEPGALAHDVHPPAHLTTQSPSVVVGQPDRGEVVSRQQLGQNPSVHLVGLDPRLGDGPRLQGIGHHHAPASRCQQRGDRRGVHGRFQRHLIAGSQPGGEAAQRLRRCRHPAFVANPAALWAIRDARVRRSLRIAVDGGCSWRGEASWGGWWRSRGRGVRVGARKVLGC